MNDSESVILAEKFETLVNQLKLEIVKVIVGQDEVILAILNSIFCHGHVLMVGVPGLAKTLLVKTISEVMDLDFNRIQFTPDLMPSDIVGSEILDEDRKFKFIKGPLFSNLILADEINRTPPKTQSALLESMQERQITANGTKYKLPNPFFVLATQNPIEQEGTYPLPEAQLDRFMYQVNLEYPSFSDEMLILKQTTNFGSVVVNKIINGSEIEKYQEIIRKIPVTDAVFKYTVNLVQQTRPNAENSHELANKFISYGAGPRAGQNLILGAKCNALMNGKFSVDVEDVQKVALWVLAHRVILNFKAEAENIRIADLVREWVK
jgi:MoxR-like ATPase